jgi:RND family efflux transporter MFP subunit
MPFIEKLKARLLALGCQTITRITQLIKKIDLVKIYTFCTLHKKKIIIGLVLIYGLNYGYNYFFPDTAKKMPPQLVTTTLVEQKDIPVILEATGNIIAKNIVDIRPQTTNVVSKIHIKEGQAVKAGDLLFTLDDRASRANLDKARALADDAARQYKRSLDLIEKKFISQAAADTSKANMESARASAKAAEVALSFDHIRSPINGRAGVINVFVGSLVQAGTNVSTTTSATSTTTTGAMATITQLDPINVQFTISEKEIPLILGQREGSDELTVSVEVNGTDKAVEGKVYVVDNQVDPAIGAVRVKAELNNQAGLMIPGQFVRIKLKAKTLKDASVIPTHAVVTNTKGDFLYVVDESNKVSLNPIKVIYQYQGQSVITGVAVDAKIVVEGKQNLRPNGQIRETKSAEKAKSQ